MIAMLLDQPPDALAFTAEHEHDGTLVVDRVPALLARTVEADDPEALRLQGLQGLDHVADAGDLDAFERARRSAGRGIRQRRGVSIGKQDAIRARGVDAADDRAEVSGVLNAVEQHEESRRARALLQFLETQEALVGHDGEDALMALAVRGPIESLAGFEAKGHAPLACALDDFEDALVAHSLGDHHTFDGAGARGQGFEDGMNSTDYGHSRFLTLRRVLKPAHERANRARTWAAIPSPRPMAPRVSVLLTLMDTWSGSTSSRRTMFRFIASR